MTKSLRLLFLLCCFVFSLNGQEAKFGVKAGLNYSSVVGDLTQGIKFRLSGHAGVFLEMEFSDKFTFKPELLYSSQGFQFSSDLASIDNGGIFGDENDFRTNVQLNYITIPVLGKFALNDKVSVEFGPQFGFLLNQVTKTKILDQGNFEIPDGRTSLSGNLQLDYGATAGIEIQITEKFALAPRFYISLRNGLEGSESGLQNYNASIQLSANYLF